MSELAHSSDDISALWGTHGLADDRLPLLAVARRRRDAPLVAPDRLEAVERQLGEGLHQLTRAIEGHRAELERALAEQFARIRSETVEDATRQITGVEATLTQRLDRMAEQLEAAMAAAPALRSQQNAELVEGLDRAGARAVAEAGQRVAGDDDRLAPLQERLDDGLSRLREAMDAQRAELAGTAELAALRSQLSAELTQRLEQAASDMAVAVDGKLAQADSRLGERLDPMVESLRSQLGETVTGQLARVRAEAVEAAAAKLTAGEDDLNDRLDAIDAIAEQMRAEAARAAGRAPSASSVLAPLRKDIGILQADVEALTLAFAGLPERTGGGTTRQAATPQTAAERAEEALTQAAGLSGNGARPAPPDAHTTLLIRRPRGPKG